MTGTALDRIPTAPVVPVTTATQATAVEQSRAAAEVQAAVVVAQHVPRDLIRAREQMREACEQLALAERAFYDVPKRGRGASVHLARELARCFGNVQYGIAELRRDDHEGLSEMQAWAWDVQNNTRSVRTIQVPHARMVGKGASKTREALTDLSDIALNNNSQAGRAVREVIFSILPVWFTAEAKEVCTNTLHNGNGVPLVERIEQMIAAYSRAHVTQAQLEERVGKTRKEWSAQEVAALSVVYSSLVNGETTREQEFSAAAPAPVTAAEITRQRAGVTPDALTEEAGQ